jgi:hypothetical protein
MTTPRLTYQVNCSCIREGPSYIYERIYRKMNRFILDQSEFSAMISGDVMTLPWRRILTPAESQKIKSTQKLNIPFYIPLQQASVQKEEELKIENIPWFHAPQGYKPRDNYFMKKLCNDNLSIVIRCLDLLDIIRLSLVNKYLNNGRRLYSFRERSKPVGFYRCYLCSYALCISFSNGVMDWCQHIDRSLDYLYL